MVDKINTVTKISESLGRLNFRKAFETGDLFLYGLLMPYATVTSPGYKSKKDLDQKKFIAYRYPLDAILWIGVNGLFNKFTYKNYQIAAMAGQLQPVFNATINFDTKRVENYQTLLGEFDKHAKKVKTPSGALTLSPKAKKALEKMFHLSRYAVQYREIESKAKRDVERFLELTANPHYTDKKLAKAIDSSIDVNDLLRVMSHKRHAGKVKKQVAVAKDSWQKMKLYEEKITTAFRNLLEKKELTTQHIDVLDPYLIKHNTKQFQHFGMIARYVASALFAIFIPLITNYTYPYFVKKLNPELDQRIRHKKGETHA